MAHGHEHGHSHGHGHKFKPERAARLHSPEREARQHWKPLLDLLDLKKITAVADVGAGTGYFAIPLAKALAGRGKVYALDLVPEMLGLLKERAEDLQNLEVMLTKEPQLPLPNACVDAVLMVNMLHEFADLKASLLEVRRILRQGGTVVVSDWKKIPTAEGPPIEVRFTEDEARAALEAAGFDSITFHDLYPEHFTCTCGNSGKSR